MSKLRRFRCAQHIRKLLVRMTFGQIAVSYGFLISSAISFHEASKCAASRSTLLETSLHCRAHERKYSIWHRRRVSSIMILLLIITPPLCVIKRMPAFSRTCGYGNTWEYDNRRHFRNDSYRLSACFIAAPCYSRSSPLKFNLMPLNRVRPP